MEVGPGAWPGHQGRTEPESEEAMAVGEGRPGTVLHLREKRQAQQEGPLHFRGQEGWGEKWPLGPARILGSRGD